jgi:thiamine biosynthesis lipoprotein
MSRETSPAASSEKPLRFGHEAMNTDFTIFVDPRATDTTYAGSATHAAFARLDRVEEILSRFVASSDIAKVNALAQGESYVLEAETWDCLCVAARMAAATSRAFDPATGVLIDFWKAWAKAPVPPSAGEHPPGWHAAWEQHRQGEFALDPASRSITCVSAGSKLDLGAIGKGYALDEMARVLENDWGVSNALLSAGGSTVLALDAPGGRAGWKIGFGGETRLPLLLLARRALSSSGSQMQPTHLLDPRSGEIVQRTQFVRAVAPTAAEADALSTAFFIMDREGIAAHCAGNPEHIALLAQALPEDGPPSAFDVIGEASGLSWAEGA